MEEKMNDVINDFDLLEVDVTPKGKDIWSTLGTEYGKSFEALKEMVDNSISASNEGECDIIIKIDGLNGDENYIISVEDKSGGVKDPSELLTIASQSESKEGLYNYYGFGLKNALAYFQPKHSASDWLIQSKTIEDIENECIVEVNAPYVYNNEVNHSYGHNGIHVLKNDINDYKGEFSDPSTFIQFKTKKNKFNNLNPVKGKGAPLSSLKTIATDLSDLFSFFYRPLVMGNKLNITIKFKEKGDDFKSIKVKTYDFPIYETMHKEKSNIDLSDGVLKVNAKWFLLDRPSKKEHHPYIKSQKYGLLLYINGILVEPYKWEKSIFGDHERHPTYNNVCCMVEVNGDKKVTPELSVSKTKIQESGKNYTGLIDYLRDYVPVIRLNELKNHLLTPNESVKRDRRYQHLEIGSQDSPGSIKGLSTERKLSLPNDVDMGGHSLKLDIFYENSQGVVFEEFKKKVVKPHDVSQVITYYKILKLEFPDKHVKCRLVSESCNDMAKFIIEIYKEEGIDIEFKTFSNLRL